MAFGNATKGYVKKHSGGGGGGGTTNYSALSNKPQINGITLDGNKTSEDLGITSGVNFTVEELTNGTFKLSDYKLLLIEGKNQYGIIGTGLFFTANMNTTDRYNFSVTEKTNNFTFRVSIDSNDLITIIKSAGEGELSHIYGIK